MTNAVPHLSHPHRTLYAILAAYLLLGIVYSVTTPLFEASDELWHYPMVKYLADHGLSLPPQDPTNPGSWRQEGSQPPLYYMLAAVLTGWIDTSDMDRVRRQNPHADIGIVRPDGNANMIVHEPGAEAFPWQGTVLAVQITRLFSVLLGMGTVLVTYALGRELFEDQHYIALGAAALVAFTPMFLFISGSVNNDNLSNLLGNLLTLLIVRLLKMSHVPKLRFYALLGIVTGAGLLAKLNIGFLIPIVALSLLVVTIRLRDWKPLVLGSVISGGITIAVAGWWYLRNWQLYGDPSGLAMFLQMVGRRAIPANAAQLWSERHSFTQAYWGFFGGVNVPMPEWVYLVFNIIGGIGLAGALVFVVSTLARQRWSLARWLPAAVTLLWSLVTFVSYLRWTAETPASQGRLVFGALSSIAVWMVVGLTWWLAARWRPLLSAAVAGWFVVIAAAAPFVMVAPAYALPEQIMQDQSVNQFTASDGGSVGVQRAEVSSTSVQPEDYVFLTVDWQIEQAFVRDWSIFVHLRTPDGVIIAQRDVYPGGGTLATSDLLPGRAWHNPIAVWVPDAAYAPMLLDVVIGWYNLPTGERLLLADGSDTLLVGQVQLVPRETALDVPNPLNVNFAGELELVGYAISDLTPAPGDTIEVTLYWRGLQPIERDYKVFVQVLDSQTLTRYAASDAMPAGWSAPTSTWQAGAVVVDRHLLTVAPDTPPERDYELAFGLYQDDGSGSFPRLRIVTRDGGMANDIGFLSRVRVVLPVSALTAEAGE